MAKWREALHPRDGRGRFRGKAGWATRIGDQIGVGRGEHVPVRGRDLRGELDYREMWGEGPGNFMEGPDHVLGRIQMAQGFDGAPQVVTEAEMDAAVADGWIEMFRRTGVTPEQGVEWTEQFRTGTLWPGLGGYGNGTYTAPAYRRSHIAGYGEGELRIALRPDAKIADMWDLDHGWRQEFGMADPYQVQNDDYEYAVLADLGRWAAARGYDAMAVTGQSDNRSGVIEEWVILNRTAVMVQEADRG